MNEMYAVLFMIAAVGSLFLAGLVALILIVKFIAPKPTLKEVK